MLALAVVMGENLIGVTLVRERPMSLGLVQRQGDLLDDVTRFCDESLPEGSVFRFLHRERDRLFPDEMFADLFTMQGRRSVPPSVVGLRRILPVTLASPTSHRGPTGSARSCQPAQGERKRRTRGGPLLCKRRARRRAERWRRSVCNLSSFGNLQTCHPVR